MTPKEKAKQLVERFFGFGDVKQCALIAVEEIKIVVPYLSKELARENPETLEQLDANDNQFVSYWEEVAKEINAIEGLTIAENHQKTLNFLNEVSSTPFRMSEFITKAEILQNGKKIDITDYFKNPNQQV